MRIDWRCVLNCVYMFALYRHRVSCVNDGNNNGRLLPFYLLCQRRDKNWKIAPFRQHRTWVCSFIYFLSIFDVLFTCFHMYGIWCSDMGSQRYGTMPRFDTDVTLHSMHAAIFEQSHIINSEKKNPFDLRVQWISFYIFVSKFLETQTPVHIQQITRIITSAQSFSLVDLWWFKLGFFKNFSNCNARAHACVAHVV